MKLARCIKPGNGPFWAVADSDTETLRPISGNFHDWAPLITNGAGEEALSFTGETLSFADIRFLPPIEKTNKVVIAGANYGKHLDEFGVDRPKQPVAFLKSYGALIGAHDDIRYPPTTEKLDYEVEMVVVIGSAVTPGHPMKSVLGFTVGNDVSARDIQRDGAKGIGMDLFGAKSQDLTTGTGPWIVTKDEFPAGSPILGLTLTVNDKIRQNGSTGDMLWNVGELIEFANARSSFECGDILFTGTPEGVADATGDYLQPGDIVEATVDGIGTLRNIVGQKK